MSDRRRDDGRESTGSWLDEISLATKLVVVVTLATIAGFLLFLIVDLFV